MKIVVVRYRKEEDGAWIATSPAVPGFYAYGDSYDEAQGRVQEGLPDFAEEPDMLITHVTGSGGRADGETGNPRVRFGISRQSQPASRYEHHLSGAAAP